MASRGYNLLTNASATGSDVQVTGGRMSFIVVGNFSGATIALEMEARNGSYLEIASVSAEGKTDLDIPDGKYRVSVTGGPPSALYADLVNIKYY